MNIALFLNRDIHSNVALNLLLDTLDGHRAWVFLSEGVGRPPAVPELDQLRFLEQDLPNRYLFPLLEALDPDGTGAYLTFGQIARRWGFPVTVENAPNDPVALERLRALDLDLVVSIRYGKIFKQPFLAMPRLGVLNLHSGVLPDYRGVLATFRALADGGAVGCTLHYIDDATIDTGPVVHVARMPGGRSRSLFGHVLGVYPIGAAALADAVATLAGGGTLHTTPQPPGTGAYYTYPTADEVAAFLAKGYRIFHVAEVRNLLDRYLPPAVPGEEVRT